MAAIRTHLPEVASGHARQGGLNLCGFMLAWCLPVVCIFQEDALFSCLLFAVLLMFHIDGRKPAVRMDETP